ncbi:MAG: hypothetical protein Kow00127_09930 [Bacteroidales bacterium]
MGYDSDGGSVSLTGSPVGEDLQILRAEEPAPGSGQVTPSVQVFDFSQTNFPELVTLMPDTLEYNITIETNSNPTAGEENFLYYDYPIRVSAEAQVSGTFSVNDLFSSDTVDWNAAGIDASKVAGGFLKVRYLNGFPFDFVVTVTLLNETGQPLRNLLEDAPVAAGMIDASGRVTEPVTTVHDIAVTAGLLDHIAQASSAAYEIYISSAGGSGVRLYDTDRLAFQIIGDFTWHVEE